MLFIGLSWPSTAAQLASPLQFSSPSSDSGCSLSRGSAVHCGSQCFKRGAERDAVGKESCPEGRVGRVLPLLLRTDAVMSVHHIHLHLRRDGAEAHRDVWVLLCSPPHWRRSLVAERCSDVGLTQTGAAPSFVHLLFVALLFFFFFCSFSFFLAAGRMFKVANKFQLMKPEKPELGAKRNKSNQ